MGFSDLLGRLYKDSGKGVLSHFFGGEGGGSVSEGFTVCGPEAFSALGFRFVRRLIISSQGGLVNGFVNEVTISCDAGVTFLPKRPKPSETSRIRIVSPYRNTKPKTLNPTP